MQTAIYSRVDSLEIKVDFQAPPSAKEGVLPGVIFFHGGGMVVGSRREYLDLLVESAHEKGMIFFTADYRLIHPSTGFDIIADVRALFACLADASFSETYLPDGISLDPARLAVIGASGGGYAARAAGLYATPKPRAVYLLYGMGGTFLSDHWVCAKGPAASLGPGDELVEDSEVAHLFREPLPPVAECANMSAEGEGSDRILLFSYWWRRGELLDYVLGEPVSARLRALPEEERVAAVPEHLRPALLEAQLDKTFPPTVLVHGGADTGVLPEESRVTFERLRAVGVTAELEVVPDAPHGLLTNYSPVEFAPGAEEAVERGMMFIARYA
ncbi:alpha/beta-hydrolase [Daedalea quercina L-15889]|uniref:Alpha/beta-hydrolase n=1 Tax=Daedalea quercina L-15889 TaxID=1314783 RepID=A0A165KHF6_9APHY|nr:alpha/beta-hydrolase [Daedalea quercina L-15889]